MQQEKWVWMPHPGHLIVGSDCRFHLSTYVGKYIVSTVGEWLPDSSSWDIYARSKGVALEGKGDTRRSDFLKKVGYVEIGYNRKYETMVFRARKAKPFEGLCCLWRQVSGADVDMAGYNDSVAALRGHLKLCRKWAQKP